MLEEKEKRLLFMVGKQERAKYNFQNWVAIFASIFNEFFFGHKGLLVAKWNLGMLKSLSIYLLD